MQELSLHLLDIAINSLDAGATKVKIDVRMDDDSIQITVADNGGGMSDGVLKRCTDKGYSTKGSKGMGLALLNEECTACGGHMKVSSTLGKGTEVLATFDRRNNRCKPLGNMGATIVPLLDERADIFLRVEICNKTFSFDTQSLKERGLSLADASTMAAVKKNINEEIYKIGGAKL